MTTTLEQLANNKSRPDGLTAIAEEVSAGRGKLAFDDLWDEACTGSKTRVDAVQRLMGALEKVWERDEGVAGYLMGRLLPLASENKLHEICNAVELYFRSSESERLSSSLERLSNEEIAPRYRSVFDWHLRRIRGAAERPS